jgi:hypothetical protein
MIIPPNAVVTALLKHFIGGLPSDEKQFAKQTGWRLIFAV